MDKVLDVDIISPEKKVFNGQAKVVTVPGVMGLFQILYMHAPMIALFENGIIKVEKPDGISIEFSTRGGVVEVKNNKVEILADAAEGKNDIDVKRAENSLKRAEERLKEGGKNLDRDRAKFSMQRARIRLKVAGVLK